MTHLHIAEDLLLNLSLSFNFYMAQCNEPQSSDSIWTTGTSRQVWTSPNQLKEKVSVRESDRATVAVTNRSGNVRET